MGKLLTKVLSTNDRGLIGVTQEEEEVPLSAPTRLIADLPRRISRKKLECIT